MKLNREMLEEMILCIHAVTCSPRRHVRVAVLAYAMYAYWKYPNGDATPLGREFVNLGDLINTIDCGELNILCFYHHYMY